MQRHNLAQHMQEFTQMHMRYMAEFLRGLCLNGTTPKSLWAQGPSVSSEDLGAAASVPACSGPRGAASCSGNNCAPSQPNEEMQRLREMDGRLVKQDHQLREVIILKETQVKDGMKFVTMCNHRTCHRVCCLCDDHMSPTCLWSLSYTSDIKCDVPAHMWLKLTVIKLLLSCHINDLM